MVCGLIAAIVLARGSVLKAIGMVVLGLLLGLAGSDINSGIRRFTFDQPGLADGIEFVALSMAIYGMAEVAYNLEKKEGLPQVTRDIGRVWPAWSDIALCIPSILRGTVARRAARRPAGRRRAAGRVRRLHAREEGRASRRGISAKAISAASRRRNPPTMPARRPRSSRC